MGNQLISAHEVEKDPCSFSPELKWKLYRAKHKERGDEMTLFIFEKKLIDKYATATKDAIHETLRRDAGNLQRLRHPKLLHVMEPLIEERTTLAFAVRRVECTLAQLLERSRHELSDLEMKCGLLDIVEAIQFLHNDVKTAHLGLSPHCIFVTKTGRWLLGGLAHTRGPMDWGTQQPSGFAFTHTDGHQSSSPSAFSADPPLRYAAPEMTDKYPGTMGLESDIFSLGLIAYELMSKQREPLLRVSGLDRSNHHYQCKKVVPIQMGSVPNDLYNILLSSLTMDPNQRSTIDTFLNSEFFHDLNIKALRFLEALNEKEDSQRLQFLRGLSKLLDDPSSPLAAIRIYREKIIPSLAEALQFPTLYAEVVPLLITSLKKKGVTDKAHFTERVWPRLRDLLSAREISVECVTMLIREIETFMAMLDKDSIQKYLTPFVLRCLELNEPNILQETLEKIPKIHNSFDYRQIKESVLPCLLKHLLTTQNLKIRAQILMGLNQIMQIFDKHTVIEKILPAFEKVVRIDHTPAILMCVLGCLDAMSKQLGAKTTAERILPLLTPMLMEESLTSEQWQTQMAVCKKLLQRVEDARTKDYAAKDARDSDVKAALGSQNMSNYTNPLNGSLNPLAGLSAGASTAAAAAEDSFESLLMGTSVTPSLPSKPAAPPAAPPAPPAFGGGRGGGSDLSALFSIPQQHTSGPSTGLDPRPPPPPAIPKLAAHALDSPIRYAPVAIPQSTSAAIPTTTSLMDMPTGGSGGVGVSSQPTDLLCGGFDFPPTAKAPTPSFGTGMDALNNAFASISSGPPRSTTGGAAWAVGADPFAGCDAEPRRSSGGGMGVMGMGDMSNMGGGMGGSMGGGMGMGGFGGSMGSMTGGMGGGMGGGTGAMGHDMGNPMGGMGNPMNGNAAQHGFGAMGNMGGPGMGNQRTSGNTWK